MKMEKRNFIFMSIFIIAVIIIAVLSISLYESQKEIHEEYSSQKGIHGELINFTSYIGENENWKCEYKVSTERDPENGLYWEDLKISYKHNDINDAKFYARLMHGTVEVSVEEATSFNSSNIIHTGAGTSGMKVFTQPLKIYISLDGGEEECIELQEVE